ncbi:hypothetical protein BHM03_00062239 [Ensete ventricosum]|nr:hypothetical protein BHM03_00062239 [Ensete ventricosum]
MRRLPGNCGRPVQLDLSSNAHFKCKPKPSPTSIHHLNKRGAAAAASTEKTQMASTKVVAVALLCVMVLSVAAVDATSYTTVDNSCYCVCMIERCMITPGATKEACAPSCDEGCVKAGLHGRIDEHDFCGSSCFQFSDGYSVIVFRAALPVLAGAMGQMLPELKSIEDEATRASSAALTLSRTAASLVLRHSRSCAMASRESCPSRRACSLSREFSFRAISRASSTGLLLRVDDLVFVHLDALPEAHFSFQEAKRSSAST